MIERMVSRFRRSYTRSGKRTIPPKGNQLRTRPFEVQDLLSVPENYRFGPPGFVGIGCPKAGTSWWYRMLLEHPSIISNRLKTKELCFLQHFTYYGFGSEAIETYTQAFAAPDGCICGEWSTGYLHYPLAIEHLAQAAPDTKLLAIVRNPVDRFLSEVNQQSSVRQRWLKVEGPYVVDRLIFLMAIHHNLLTSPFERLLKVWDRSQLLVLQYEQCTRDPASEIARTYCFLGLDDTYTPESLNRKVNVRPYTVPKLTPNERLVLADYFAEDVCAFANLFPEIDLSLWPDFERTR